MSGCQEGPHSRKVDIVRFKAQIKKDDDAAAERERLWQEKIAKKKAEKDQEAKLVQEQL
jgi:hypothetical protein